MEPSEKRSPVTTDAGDNADFGFGDEADDSQSQKPPSASPAERRISTHSLPAGQLDENDDSIDLDALVGKRVKVQVDVAPCMQPNLYTALHRHLPDYCLSHPPSHTSSHSHRSGQ
jgi:hypothetical protein